MEPIGDERTGTAVAYLAQLAREVRRADLSATVEPNRDPFPSLVVEGAGARGVIVVGATYYWWDRHGDLEVVGPVTALAGAARAVVTRFRGEDAGRSCAAILGTRAIPATPAEVAPMRRWLSGLLTPDHAPIVDDVVLLACEAVTNSLLHSDSAKTEENGEPGVITLVVLDVGDAVRVEVIDAGSDHNVPRVADDDPIALNGRGLHMLDYLTAGRWDSYADADGRTTWFEIAGPP